MRPSTANDYAERIARVALHIGEHLDARLALDDLAAIAHLSPYHFHRVYRAILGETTAMTVRRRRLERAAVDLIDTARPLDRIAARAGYGSIAAFTRAFSSAYGVGPVSYRKHQSLRAALAAHTNEAIVMYDVIIKTHPGATLAVVPHKGSYQTIGTAFERLGALAGASGIGSYESVMIGVYLDDPDSVPEADLRALAGIAVHGPIPNGRGLDTYVIPPGPIATVLHRGPYAELPRAYSYLYSQWLPHSGREPADAPCFETYLNDPRSVSAGELLTEVAMPLAR